MYEFSEIYTLNCISWLGCLISRWPWEGDQLLFELDNYDGKSHVIIHMFLNYFISSYNFM